MEQPEGITCRLHFPQDISPENRQRARDCGIWKRSKKSRRRDRTKATAQSSKLKAQSSKLKAQSKTTLSESLLRLASRCFLDGFQRLGRRNLVSLRIHIMD